MMLSFRVCDRVAEPSGKGEKPGGFVILFTVLVSAGKNSSVYCQCISVKNDPCCVPGQ